MIDCFLEVKRNTEVNQYEKDKPEKFFKSR